MNSASRSCLLNGEIASAISVFDRGLNYGHGLFETMRVASGGIPLWRFHQQRLKSSALRLGIDVDDLLLEDYLQCALRHMPDHGVLKLLITAGESGRGYAQSGQEQPNYLIQWSGLPESLESYTSQRAAGIAVWLCQQRLAIIPTLAGIKHLNRLEQVLARAEQPISRFAEGLMLDYDDYLVEGVASNLFCRKGSHWLTPKLDRCGVAGVMREYLLSTHSVTECRLRLNDLSEVDELFLCNAVHGIRPVVSVEGIGDWEVGQQTREWMQKLGEEILCFA